MAEPVLHPATWKLFQEAARRWALLKERHCQHERAAWLGFMVSQFTDDELVLLNERGYMCPDDLDRLRGAGRPVRKANHD